MQLGVRHDGFVLHVRGQAPAGVPKPWIVARRPDRPRIIEGMAVTTGSARLAAHIGARAAGRRVGLLSNPASLDAGRRHVVDVAAAAPEVRLTALFGPQHGFRSDVQDNMIETDHARHPRLGVPVYSLYGETRAPTPAMLSEIDVLVVDLQDVGTRVYTYVHTMTNCLQACAAAASRSSSATGPNPVGGAAVEGPMLRPGFESFVGQFPVPLRHGLTIGELARLCNETFGLGASVEVLPLDGWRRDAYHDETGLPWVLPSPNLPTLDSAVVYPGMVLLEGTNLSEGRGTTRPFELAGAPWLDAHALAEAMNGLGLPGAWFRPAEFQPTFQKHAGETCGGCQIPRGRPRRVPARAHRGGLAAGLPPARPRPVRVARAALRVRGGHSAHRHPVRL